MSNEIQTDKVSVNIANTKSQASGTITSKQSDTTVPPSVKAASADTVSMTDDASRLQEIEGMLKNMPAVNKDLISEISQLIANGGLEINLERTASKLLETEAGITDTKS